MSCGLPTSVAAAPILLAIASATRNGTGLRPLRRSAVPTTGAKTKHTMSWFRNADRPATTTMSANKKRAGLSSRAARPAAILSKNPVSRSCADSTKNPNRSRIVGQSTKPTTVCVGSPEAIMTAIAPSSAMPVRLSRRPGTCPMAMPQYVSAKMTTIAVVPGSAPCAMPS